MQPPLGGRWFLYHDFYSNPWIFAVTQRFIGIATLLSGNCGISNPILSCALESPESLETTGIAGRRDPEVGSIATHLTFSRLLFDLAHTRPKTCDSEVCPNWPHTGPTRPALVQGRVFSRPSLASIDTEPHRGRQAAMNSKEKRTAICDALRSGILFSIKRTRYKFHNSSRR